MVTSGPFGTGLVTITNVPVTLTTAGGARILDNPVTLFTNLTISGSSALTLRNGPWTIAGNRTVTVSSTADITFQSGLTDDNTARTLTKAGTGKLIMMTTNSPFLGGITASAGTLAAGNSTPFPTK